MRTEPNPTPTAFEQALITALLAGDHPLLDTLRRQYAAAHAVDRELSGRGLFLNFDVPAGLPRVSPPDFELGDVHFDLAGLLHGGGAILFIRDGVLDFLEAFSYDEDWPEQEVAFAIRYGEGDRNQPSIIREVGEQRPPNS